MVVQSLLGQSYVESLHRTKTDGAAHINPLNMRPVTLSVILVVQLTLWTPGPKGRLLTCLSCVGCRLYKGEEVCARLGGRARRCVGLSVIQKSWLMNENFDCGVCVCLCECVGGGGHYNSPYKCKGVFIEYWNTLRVVQWEGSMGVCVGWWVGTIVRVWAWEGYVWGLTIVRVCQRGGHNHH